MLSTLVPNTKGGFFIKPIHSLDDLLPLVESQIELDREITNREKIEIFRSAIIDTKTSNTPTMEFFLKILAEKERMRIRAPKINYYLTTTISLEIPKNIGRIKRSIDSSEVNISDTYPAHLKTGPYFFNGIGNVDSSQPHQYSRLWVKVCAKSEQSAGEQALNSISKFVAACNFLISRGRIISSGKMVPQNRIRLGPYQSLHRQDGTLSESHLWYEPYYNLSLIHI